MYDKYLTLVLGLITAIGIGCAGPSSLTRVGNPKNGDKAGMVTATSSKYTFLHMEWGNDSIGSLAHKNGIRYVLNANHREIGLPLFGKITITIYGAPDLLTLKTWENEQLAAYARATLIESIAQAKIIAPSNLEKQRQLALALAKEKIFWKHKDRLVKQKLREGRS